PLHPDRAAEIAADVAGALSYAHRHGVIHRDVKPGNVLITEEGTIKVTDFGIARAVNTEESLTQTGAVMGTATYFSPEQAEGLGVDARSDIYSLGVVLYEMVTGRPPFLGDTPVAVASKHVREHPPGPREVNPGLPPDLEAIILKCLAKTPEHRYPTGDDLRIDLLRFREGRAVDAVVHPTGQHPTVGTTQAVALAPDGTQALPQVWEEEEAREPSRTGLYATILAVLLAALAVVLIFLGNSLGWWHIGGPPASFALRDVAGQNVNAAEAALHRDGLKTKVRSDASANTTPNTQVIRTSPAKGSAVHKGETITVVTGSQGPPVKVKDVTGFNVAAAQSVLRQQGLQVVQQSSTASTCTQQGVVCSQSPPGGSTLLPGKTVTIFVAANTKPVPDVRGLDLTTACNRLGAAGFQCASTTQPSGTVAKGDVISQSPAQNSQQPPNATVNLVVSSGPSTIPVPDVLQETEQQAVSTLQGDNFTVTATCQPTLDPTQAGLVQSQDPTAGTMQPSGSNVSITVAGFPDCSSTSSTTSTTS
ncbi:MAG TPA: PASTA domain-containing protein, partial [Acidimicrobiales bacterium]|nr:PASTA domain-containing protein [Acidimicrobiales bacterium]